MGPYGSDVGFAVAVLAIAGVVLTVTLALEFISERRDK
tara:strand:- start:19 stop:132 length:114 start_codon:yes stop_codon:yes gene_type:complete